eukprot:SAG11_NODE_144_length_14830_cov_17.955943_4_plen_226_part_00
MASFTTSVTGRLLALDSAKLKIACQQLPLMSCKKMCGGRGVGRGAQMGRGHVQNLRERTAGHGELAGGTCRTCRTCGRHTTSKGNANGHRTSELAAWGANGQRTCRTCGRHTCRTCGSALPGTVNMWEARAKPAEPAGGTRCQKGSGWRGTQMGRGRASLRRGAQMGREPAGGTRRQKGLPATVPGKAVSLQAAPNFKRPVVRLNNLPVPRYLNFTTTSPVLTHY